MLNGNFHAERQQLSLGICSAAMLLGSVGGLLILGASCRAEVRVEGDAALLKILREGLATAASQHRRGSLAAKVVYRQPPILETELEIHEHVWDGDRWYWKYSGGSVTRFPGKSESIQRSNNSEMILRPDLKCWHFPDLKSAIIRRRPDELGMQDTLDLRPVRCWYSYNRGKTPWDRMLDPADVPQNVTHFEVEKAGSDRVIVTRHRTKGKLRVEFSLAHGGNIVSYLSEQSETIYRGTYDWVGYSPGNWRLKETVQEQVPASDPDTPVQYYRLEILEFDPQPRIPANRFQCTSFNLAEGTQFHRYDVQGNRIRGAGAGGKGGLLKTPDQENLDELVDQLRSGGFAAPERAP